MIKSILIISGGVLINRKNPQSSANTQSAFTYSKLTLETLEEGVKYVQS